MVKATARIEDKDVPVELCFTSPRRWKVTSGILGGRIIPEAGLVFTSPQVDDGRCCCSACGRSFRLAHAVSHCEDHAGQFGID